MPIVRPIRSKTKALSAAAGVPAGADRSVAKSRPWRPRLTPPGATRSSTDGQGPAAGAGLLLGGRIHAGAERQRHRIGGAAGRAEPGLAAHRSAPVMLDPAGAAEERGEGLGQGDSGEVGKIRRARLHDAAGQHRATHGDPDPRCGVDSAQFGDGRGDTIEQFGPRNRTTGRAGDLGEHRPVGREPDGLEVRAADVEADERQGCLSAGMP